MVSWLCSCLGGQQADLGPAATNSPEQDTHGKGQRVAVKQAPVKQLTVEVGSETHSSDLQDKDQGTTAAQQQQQQDSQPLPQQQAESSGSGPGTPHNALPWQIEQQSLQTWSPSHVSLDLPGLQQHASISALHKQERTLRALLDKVNKFGLSATSSSGAAVQHTPQQLHHADVARIREQILTSCSAQRPGPEVHDRVAQLLQELHAWLVSPPQANPASPSHGGSAIVLLHGAGDALAHAEHFARSAGQVQFWSAAVVRQLVALLRVYTALIDQCLAAGAAAKAAPGSCGRALVSTLAQLLVRPSLVDLLAQVLQLVHLNAEFRATAQRHEAVGAAIAVLDFLRDVVRLAGADVEAVGRERLAECLVLLAGMLAPPNGLLPRTLQQPLSADNMSVQLHTLYLLRQLFDAPPEVLRQVLNRSTAGQASTAGAPSSAAAFYMSHHLTEAARCYFASNGDPASACAELCLLHVRLVRSLCRGGMTATATAGEAGSAARINELLLSELSAQYTASQAVALLAAEQDAAARSTTSVSDSSSDEGGSSSGELPQQGSGAGQPPAGASEPAVLAPGVAKPACKSSGAAGDKSGDPSGKFEFTYDLNEDLARIMELEEKLGEAVEVDGFEYDQEGKQLLQRSSVMAAAAESFKAPISRRSMGQAPNSGRPLAVSDGGRPAVPKLSFTSFSRSALSSSRSIVPSSSLAPSAAPSARAMASPARQPPAAAAEATPAVVGRPSLHLEEPLARQLLQGNHMNSLGSVPGSPLASQRVPSILVTRGSPSRLSACGGTQRARRRSSPSIAALLADGGTPFATTSVHFADDDDERERSVAVPTVSDPVPVTAPSTGIDTRHDLPEALSGDSDSAAAPISVAAVAGGPGAALPPVPRPALVPALDFSGLGAGSKNARSTGGASSTGGHGRNGRLGSRPNSALATAASTGDRRVPDSANDAAGKVNGVRKGFGCAPAIDAVAPSTGPAPGARASLASVSSAQRSQSQRGPRAASGVIPSTVASTARPSTGASACTSAPTSLAAAVAASSCSISPGAATAITGDPMQRLLFRDPKLHTSLIALALEASITPSGHLDATFWQQYPLDNGAQYNLEYLLTWHLHNAGAPVVLELLRRLESGTSAQAAAAAAAVDAALAAVSSAGTMPSSSAPPPVPTAASAALAQLRLLRLLSKAMFDASRYSELKFMARGAYSNVYRAKARLPAAPATASAALQQGQGARGAPSMQQQQQQVIIKTVALPASRFDRCVLPDMYGEIAIMEQYKGCPGICQMLDYGLTDDAFWIVMKKYRCSLADWRQRQTLGPGSAAAAALYLSILLQVVAALKVLAQDSVVHFDLKCSNVLIDPHLGAKDSEILNPLGPAGAGGSAAAAAKSDAAFIAPFDAVLADFGEARSYRNADEAFTVRNRGTEVYKSPEMLLLNTRPTTAGPCPVMPAMPPSADPGAAAKAALQGAGLASDVWSLGCLAYELLTGKVLFGGDYASVTHRVAFGGRGNLALLPAERAALGDRAQLVGLLEWILARDPVQRPSLDAIQLRLQDVRQELVASAAAGVTQPTAVAAANA